MPSTYTVNLGIEKPATGEQSGTWGDTTNTNFDILDQGINGAVRVTLTSAGSSGSPNSLAITNGAASDGRNKWIEFYSSGDLSGSVYVQLDPNDAEKIVFVRNSLAGSRSVLLFQGTYNSGRDLEVPAGMDMVVKFDGGGASAATVTNVYQSLRTEALNIAGDGATVTGIKDEDNMSSDSATKLATQQSIKAYVDAQVGSFDTLAEVLANGNTTGSTDIEVTSAQKVQFRDAAIYINSSADGQLDIVADTEVQIAATTVDLNGNLDVSGTVVAGGVVTANAGVVVDNFTLDGTTLALSSGAMTLDAVGNIILDSDAGQVVLADGGSNKGLLKLNGNNLEIKSEISDADIKFNGNDGGSAITALTLDFSAAGAATFNNSVTTGGLVDVRTSHTSTDVTAANSNTTLRLLNSGSGDGVYNAIKFSGNQQDMYIMSVNDSTQADRRLGFFVGSVAGDATTDERLSINGNGSVGIGTLNGDVTNDGTAARTYVGIIGTANRGRLNLGSTASNGADSGVVSFVNGANQLGALSMDTNSGSQTVGKMYLTSTDDLTLTSAGSGDINLDSGGSDILLKVAGTSFASFRENSGNFRIKSEQSDKDMLFMGSDGGSEITALTLDMSAAGAATFNSNVSTGGNLTIPAASIFYLDGAANTYMTEVSADNLQFVVGGAERFRIAPGAATVTGTLTATTADNSDTLSLISTDADANSGPNLRMYRNSASPADSDIFGQIHFEGRNDNSQDFIAVQIDAASGDVSDGTEDGELRFDVMTAGTLREYLRLASGSNPAVIVNQDGQDINFQVQSDANTHMLFVDGGNNRIGVNTGSPLEKLQIDDGNIVIYNTGVSSSANATIGHISGRGRVGSTDPLARMSFGTDAVYYHGVIDFQLADDYAVGALETRLKLYTDEAVFNEDSSNIDFRVESDGNANMLFVDGGENRVGVGTAAPDSIIHILENTNNSGTTGLSNGGLQIENVEATSGSWSQLHLKANAKDAHLRLTNAGNLIVMTESNAAALTISEAGAATFGGSVLIPNKLEHVGDADTYLQFSGADDWRVVTGNVERFSVNNSAVVVNEESADLDFRVESNSNTHALFVDAANDSLGIFNSVDTDMTRVALGLNGVAISGDTDGATIGSAGIAQLFNMNNFGTADATIMLLGGGHGGGSTGQIASGFGFARHSASTWGTQIKMYVHPDDTVDLDELHEAARVGPNEFVINETANNYDFRVESVNQSQMFVVDASADSISLGNLKVAIYASDTNAGYIADGGNVGIRFSQPGVDDIVPCDTSGADRDNAINFGAAGARWGTIFAATGTINTSDQNEKQDIAELSEAEQRVAVAAKGLLRKFRWKDSVAEKGDAARTHVGIIAQDLQAAFAAEGLDASDYAMWCSDTWTDKETGEEHTRMGVRYSELLAFIISAI